MVKSLTAILVSFALLLGAGLFEWFYVGDQFKEFQEQAETLAEKTKNETVNIEDAKAVQSSWEDRKKHLNNWIPHNDISRIDDYMSETVRLVGEKEYSLALAKLEIIIHLTECLPGNYRPEIQNIL